MGFISAIRALLKRRVCVVFHGVDTVYDGCEHSPGYDITGLPNGYTADVSNLVSIRDATPAPVVVNSAVCSIKNMAGKDVTHRFAISFTSTTIMIRPAELIIKTLSMDKVYDGVPLKPPSAEVCGLIGEDEIVFDTVASPADVGNYSSLVRIDWERSSARQSNYKIRFLKGSLEIKARPLTVIAGSAEKEYDGKPLKYDAVNIEGLISGETLSVRCIGEITDEGETTNCALIRWGDSTARPQNYETSLIDGQLVVIKRTFDVVASPTRCVFDDESHFPRLEIPDGATVLYKRCEQYREVGKYSVGYTLKAPHYFDMEGVASLVIEPAPLVVRIVGGRFRYDGMEHRASIEVEGLPAGYTAEVTSNAVVKNVSDGQVIARCDAISIKDSRGIDMTHCFYVDTALEAIIEVVPTTLLVCTYDARKEYDGKAIETGGKVTGLKKGEAVTFKTTGRQIEVGTSQNTYELLFDGTARKENYIIREALGNLTVEPASIRAEGLKHGKEQDFPTAIQMGESLIDLRGKTKPRRMIDEWRTVKARKDRMSRPYRARPVAERPDLDEAGLGKDFKPSSNIVPAPLPKRPFVQKLREFETRACEEIKTLNEKDNEGLLFQCFGPFATELSELCEAFKELFDYYRTNQTGALVQIHSNFQCAFLLYVANLARSCYRDDTLWERLFKENGIRDQGTRVQFKKMFISYLYRRGMPVYEANERHTYMLDTALLHCGLTADLWQSLWKDSFLPLARAARNGLDGMHPDLTVDEVVGSILGHDVKFKPNERAFNVLVKAPHDALLSLFSASWEVALQIEKSHIENGGSHQDIVFVTSFGLSATAMDALNEVVQKKGSRRTSAKEVVYFDRVGFILDMEKDCACIDWNATHFDSSFQGKKVDFYINGERKHREELVTRADGCVLPKGSIEIKPRASYDIEVRIIETVGGEEWECGSFAQSFQNNKPGCYEFIYDAVKRQYRYREPNVRLRRGKEIAYLVDEGLRVEGRGGMELLEEKDARGDWEGMSIFVFQVKPGASGAIIKCDTDEEQSAWHEDYRICIDKDKIIGRTSDGLDLYGHALGSGRTDVALPSILIEAFEGAEAASDLEIVFSRNGVRTELETTCSPVEGADSVAIRLTFLARTQGFGISSSCELAVYQKTSGKTVMRYRFAVVPLQGFRLVDGKVLARESQAIYEFYATEDIEVSHGEDELEHIAVGEQFNFQEPLDKEYATLHIATQLTSIDVCLALVGIVVKIPEKLFKIEETGQICLGSYFGVPLSLADGAISISSFCPRRNRSVMVRLGDEKLVYKNLERSSDISANVFLDLEKFKPSSEKGVPFVRDIPLELTVAYGHELVGDRLMRSSAKLPILGCYQGLGFETCKIYAKESGFYLGFGGHEGRTVPVCDVVVTIKDTAMRKVLLTQELDAGCGGFDLPVEIARMYEGRKRLSVEVAPTSLFGDVDDRGKLVYEMKRGA